LRYVAEPRAWSRMAPSTEKDDIQVTVRVWHRYPPKQRRATAKAAPVQNPAKAAKLAKAPKAASAAKVSRRHTQHVAPSYVQPPASIGAPDGARLVAARPPEPQRAMATSTGAPAPATAPRHALAKHAAPQYAPSQRAVAQRPVPEPAPSNRTPASPSEGTQPPRPWPGPPEPENQVLEQSLADTWTAEYGPATGPQPAAAADRPARRAMAADLPFVGSWLPRPAPLMPPAAPPDIAPAAPPKAASAQCSSAQCSSRRARHCGTTCRRGACHRDACHARCPGHARRHGPRRPAPGRFRACPRDLP
jgi:hypothetical protein